MIMTKACRYKCCGCQNMRRDLCGCCRMPTRDSRAVIKKISQLISIVELYCKHCKHCIHQTNTRSKDVNLNNFNWLFERRQIFRSVLMLKTMKT